MQQVQKSFSQIVREASEKTVAKLNKKKAIEANEKTMAVVMKKYSDLREKSNAILASNPDEDDEYDKLSEDPTTDEEWAEDWEEFDDDEYEGEEGDEPQTEKEDETASQKFERELREKLGLPAKAASKTHNQTRKD